MQLYLDAQACGVCACQLECPLREISKHDPKYRCLSRELSTEAQSDCPAPRPEVGNHEAVGARSAPTPGCECMVDHLLGLGSGDQRSVVDAEINSSKGPRAEEVLEGFSRCSTTSNLASDRRVCDLLEDPGGLLRRAHHFSELSTEGSLSHRPR